MNNRRLAFVQNIPHATSITPAPSLGMVQTKAEKLLYQALARMGLGSEWIGRVRLSPATLVGLLTIKGPVTVELIASFKDVTEIQKLREAAIRANRAEALEDPEAAAERQTNGGSWREGRIILRRENESRVAFTHLTGTFEGAGKPVVNSEMLMAVMGRRLHYIPDGHGAYAMEQAMHHIGKGWKMTAGQMLKMAYDTRGHYTIGRPSKSGVEPQPMLHHNLREILAAAEKGGPDTKPIVTHLTAVVEEWLSTLPKDLADFVRPSVVISGGAILSLFGGVAVNDYDVYFDSLAVVQALADYYGTPHSILHEVGPFENIRGEIEERLTFCLPSRMGVKRVSKRRGKVHECDFRTKEEYLATKYAPKLFTQNAITLCGGMQLIMRFYGNPSQIHESYDFEHCKGYFYRGRVVWPRINGGMLTYSGSLYPLCALFRIRKFMARGWGINRANILRLMKDIRRIDFTDFKTLQDQLMGVDAAFMSQIFQGLKNDENGRIDFSYVMKLIDELEGPEDEDATQDDSDS